MAKLDGKIALISGGTSGIGAEPSISTLSRNQVVMSWPPAQR
jgi:NADP-dependent 3-hydroxy acid dehydrogenase YdfG